MRKQTYFQSSNLLFTRLFLQNGGDAKYFSMEMKTKKMPIKHLVLFWLTPNSMVWYFVSRFTPNLSHFCLSTNLLSTSFHIFTEYLHSHRRCLKSSICSLHLSHLSVFTNLHILTSFFVYISLLIILYSEVLNAVSLNAFLRYAKKYIWKTDGWTHRETDWKTNRQKSWKKGSALVR